MKKLLLALPLVAGASWAGTTYYAGNQTQIGYNKLLSQLNQLKPFTLESEEYNSGFITSTAVTKVLDSNGPNARELFKLYHTINHSPVGATNGEPRIGASSIVTKLKTDEIVDPDTLEILAAFENSTPFELQTEVKLSGEVENNLILNSFYHSEDGAEIKANGGQFAIFSDASGKVQGSGTLGEIAFTSSSGTSGTIYPSSSTFDMSRVTDAIYNGHVSFDLPTIAIKSAATGMDFELNDLSLMSKQSMDGDILSHDLSFAINNIQSPLPINAASWEFRTDGYSLERMQRFNEISQAVPLVPNAELDPMVTFNNDLESLKSLIAPGVGMNTSLVLSNDGGHIGASLNLGFIGDGSPSGYDNLNTVADLFQALTGRILIDADVDAVMQTPAAMFLMDPAISQYLVNDGVKYTSDVTMASMMLNINGETQMLEELVGPMLYMPLDFGMMAQ